MKKISLIFFILIFIYCCGSGKPKVKILSIESKGCHFCEEQQKIFEELKQKYKNKIIIEVHLIDDPDGLSYADKYGVTKFPTNIFLDNKGNVIFRADGLLKKETIIKVLNVIGVK
ncbi:MAG: thioredoxin fold domain-containing protein [Candidatus Goldbacteria bacterium]|nr:thioredoxin fold domain-containing protein [Candidatus Goldiibacteriota bacterium]